MLNFTPSNFIEKESEESKFFVLDNDSLLIFSNEQFIRPISSNELKWSGLDVNEKHFLGFLNDDPCYAVSVKKEGCISVSYTHLTLPTTPYV